MISTGSSSKKNLAFIDPAGMAFAIVVSRFNAEISDALLEGAQRGFAECGVAENALTIVHVPGAFEIPLTAKELALTKKFSGVVALGAVIRGETAHFEFVAGECARGLQQVSLETGVPVLFGVLTTETLAQAQARSGNNNSNKGWECAVAALDMAALLQTIRSEKK